MSRFAGRTAPRAGLAALLLILSACGGGGGGSSSNPAPNQAPIAHAGPDRTVDEADTVTLDGSTSTDPNGAITQYQWTQTAGPAVTLAGANTATASFTAPATASPLTLTFRLDVADDEGATDSDEVTVTVNPVNVAPVANDDSTATSEDTAVVIDVLANDTDADGADEIVPSSVALSAIQNGTATVDPATGRVTFVPAAQFAGTARFRYTVRDASGADSNAATVNIAVTAVNDPPMISDIADVTIAEDGTTGPMAFTIADVDSNPSNLTVSSSTGHGPLVPDGNVVFGGGGPNRTVTVTPASGQSGIVTITLYVSDGASDARDTFTLTVTAVNDAPQAFDDGAITDEDTPVVVDVLANDVDAEGALDPASVAIQSESHGVATVNSEGQVSFLPDANYFGTDAGFTYTVRDADGEASNVATVAITVNPVNDAPVAEDSAASGDEGATVTGTVGGSDADGDELSFAKASDPANGQVTLDAGGGFSYAPAANFAGTDSFTFVANDGTADSSPATVTLTVSDQPEATLGVTDAAAGEGDSNLVFTVSLSRAPDTAVTIHYATADGSAKAGGDYTAVSGDLVFEGETLSQTVTVPVNDNSSHEDTEKLTLALTVTDGADSVEAGADLEATGTITDDDVENTTLLRVGAAKRSTQPEQKHIDGMPEARVVDPKQVDDSAPQPITHTQMFNLGGFGINPLSNVPDDPETPVGAGCHSVGADGAPIPDSCMQALRYNLTEPAGRRVFTNGLGEDEETQVRAMAIQTPDSNTTVVFVMIDAVGAGNIIQKNLKDEVILAAGQMNPPVTLTRENILFGQTHSHAGADLQGLWGGVPQDWIENMLYPAAADAVVEALTRLQPAHLSFRQGMTDKDGTFKFNSYRRPQIDPNWDTDRTITLLQAAAASDGSPIANILQFAAHPTAINTDVSPRIPHPDYILGAVEWLEDPAHGMGGVSLYYNGPIADASGSGSIPNCQPLPPAPNPPGGVDKFREVRCRGQGMADYLLDPSHVLAERELEPTLESRAVEVYLPVTNPGFLAFGLTGSFNRYYNFMDTATDQVPEAVTPFLVNLPQATPLARTHVSRVTIGGAEGGLEIVTIPGEATGSFGRYIRGLAKTNTMLLGLTHNSFGYIIPEEEFHYVEPTLWDDTFQDIPGTAYEEHVSLGPLTAPMLRTQGYIPLFSGEALNQPVDGTLAAYLANYVPPVLSTCSGSFDDHRCLFQVVEDNIHALFDRGLGNAGDACRDMGGPEPFCAVFDQIAGIVGDPVPELEGADTTAELALASAGAAARGCDILDPSHCLLPFPSDHFTVPAAADSPQGVNRGGTGRRINFNPLAMPRNIAGKPIDPTEWNRNDGFSPGQQIITYVPNVATVKDAQGNPSGPIVGAPPITDIGQSLDIAGSSVLVLDATPGPTFGQPHPVWAEIDLNAGYLLPADKIDNPDPTKDAKPSLIVRPGRNFIETHRYVVVLKNLKDDATGATIPAQAAFRVCRDNPDPADASDLPKVRERCAELANVFSVLRSAGIAVENNNSLYLAWDFTVASAENNVARLRWMRDDAFKNYLGQVENADGGIVNLGRAPQFKVTFVDESDANEREIQGSFTIPSYVVPADPSPLEQERDIRQQLKEQFPQFAQVLDAFNNVPRQAWTVSAPPNRLNYLPDENSAKVCEADPAQLAGACAGQARYGDGLPDRTGEMTATFTCRIPKDGLDNPGTARPIVYGHGLLGGQQERGPDQEYNMMYCKADWFGFAFGDIPNVVSVLADFSNFPVIPDGSQQGMLNQLFLARLLRHPQGFVSDPAFRNAGGQPLFDNREVFYDGNSQGGILGGVVVAMSKDINRGTLGVVGMNYSTLLQRSVDYDSSLNQKIGSGSSDPTDYLPPYSMPTYLAYQDDLDRQLVFSIIQMLWDRSENNGYAHHIRNNAALHGPDNQVLLHPAFSDHQVTPWSAQVMARTMGVDVADMYQRKPGESSRSDDQDRPIPAPFTYPDRDGFFANRDQDNPHFWALPLAGRDAGAAYDEPGCPAEGVCRTTKSGFFEFDEGYTAAAPIGNVPPRADDLDPHGFPRSTVYGRCQKSHFLHTQGRIIDVRTDRNVTSAANCPALPPAVTPPAVGVGGDAVPPFPLPMCMPEGLPFAGECLPDEMQDVINTVWSTLNGGGEPAPDGDGDGAPDADDNCPTVANTGQENSDGDAQGDACDSDDDNDGIDDGADQCPTQAGPAENNGCPVQEPDTDGDGVPDSSDECPNEPGPASNNGCPEGGTEPPDTGTVEQLVADATREIVTLPADLEASAQQTADNAQNGELVKRSVEVVVMEGRSFPDWSQPPAQGVARPYPSGVRPEGGGIDPFNSLAQFACEFASNDPTEEFKCGTRDAHNGHILYPPTWEQDHTPFSTPTAVPVEDIVAFKRENSAWVEIPVQVDERLPYFLANAGSTFSTYSGTDTEVSYVWDRELWKATGECQVDPLSVVAMPDPIANLDDDDEIAFMASDAGDPAASTAPAPEGTTGPGQEIALADALNPDVPRYVYLYRRAGGSSFGAGHYVQYDRDGNGDQFVDQTFWTEEDPQKVGTENEGYGPNVAGTVCGDNVRTAEDEGTAPRASSDRFARDGVTIRSDSYQLYASGRWMIRNVQVAKPGQPGVYGADIVDRWKGRAFQQSPGSIIDIVGFEDEQVNWEANSALLGERVGPVRAIREVWGADSGTNVTKTETYYRGAYVYRYRVRVHPIPPDGLYTSWDYNRGAMVSDDPNVPGGRYYTAVRATGVPIDGVNDDIGQIDYVPPVNDTCITADGPQPASKYGGTCPLYFDVADPALNLPLAVYNWEQISAKGDLGSIVYLFELKNVNGAPNSAAVPYYRDDACLDDATGDDPVQRPWPGEKSTDSRVRDGYVAAAGGTTPYEQLRCEQKQGAHAQHGLHFFAPPESDNAFAPVTVDEMDGQQWAFPVSTARPMNVGEQYANIVRAPLVRSVRPRPAVSDYAGDDVPTDYYTCVAMAQQGGAEDQEAAAKFTCAVIFGGGRAEGEGAESEIQGPNTYVPMSDGTLIAANVYIPWACNVAKNPAARVCPSILEMSGYESGSDEGATPAGDFNEIICDNSEDGDGNCQRPLPLSEGTRGAHDKFYKSGDRYVSVVASVRGTGCSAGEFDVFSRKSAFDGYQLVEWMAGQHWSNGKVGIFGHSYSGITGAMIASTNPPHLEMVSISGQIGDIYRDIVYPGGVSNYGFPLLWTGGVRPAYDYLGGTFAGLISDSQDRQCLRNQAERSRTVENEPLISGLSDTDGPWYHERSVVNFLKDVTAPTQVVTAYQDEQTGPRGGTHVFDYLPQNLTRRLVILNGDHGSQTGPEEVVAERKFWIDRFMLGPNDPPPRPWSVGGNLPRLPAPVFADDGTATSRVLLEVTRDKGNRSNGHIDSTGFPLSQTRWTDFYFHGVGARLDTDKDSLHDGEAGSSSSYASGSKREAYSYQANSNTIDDNDAMVSTADADGADELIFALDIDSVAQDYTAPDGMAQKAFVIAGPVTADLWLTSTAPDTELMVQLIDADPATGERLYLQRGVLRASHREILAEASQCAAFPAGGRITGRVCTDLDNIYRPFRLHRPAPTDVITPGQATRYRLEIFPVSHVFRSGHQLLVKIHAPSLDDNDWAYIPRTASALNTLHHSAEHASSVRLPVIAVADISRLGGPTTTCSDDSMRCTYTEPMKDFAEECRQLGARYDSSPGDVFTTLICGAIEAVRDAFPLGGEGEPSASDVGEQTGPVLDQAADVYQDVIGSTESNGQVLAGVGVVDMTPDVGYGAGQYTDHLYDPLAEGDVGGAVDTEHMDPYATAKTQVKSYGVMSRATGRAIVIEGANGKRIVLLKSDNYLAQDNLLRRVAQILEENNSTIGYDQILYHVTHAHSTAYSSTPSWGVWLFQDAYDARFFEFQARKLAEAILIAERGQIVDGVLVGGMRPARMGATTVRHKVFKGQIMGPGTGDDGTPVQYPSEYGDLGLVVMRFETDEAQPEPIAVWVNWGEHPEGLDGYDLHSADFVAFLERFVERDLKAPLVFSQGDVGSSEKSGNEAQRLDDDGDECTTDESCGAGEGVWRDWNHKGYVQNERNVRYLADAVVKGWKVIGGEQPVDAPATAVPPNNYVPEVQVPLSNSFAVDYRNAFVPGPLSHPYPSVSNCRSEPTAGGHTGVPVIGLPDCARKDPLFDVEFPPGDNPVSAQVAMLYNTAKAHGIPVPEHYDAPAFTGVEENLRLKLQAFRLGDVILGSCACEAQVDLILNFESRANDVVNDIYDGFDWACVAEDANQKGLSAAQRDPKYAAACELQRERYFDVAEFPKYDRDNRVSVVPGDLSDPASLARMRAQIHNDANGWDAVEYVPYANAEPADPKAIKGNFTKEELPAKRGYKLAVGIGHAGDYNGYTVSYREYMSHDHYRKALTSYGAHTADYMVTRLVRMAGAMRGAAELAPEPHDAAGQADEARMVAESTALGQVTKNAYETYYAALPPDLGPAADITQPDDISYFQAANFTWVGGSTAVDNPSVTVQRCKDGESCADSDPIDSDKWMNFADQTGEVQTRVEWPQADGVAMVYAGQHKWHWTANFEAYEAFPARLGSTPEGSYRFVVEGCISDGSAPDTNVTNRIANFLAGMLPVALSEQLVGVLPPSGCKGGASRYTLASEAFEVSTLTDLVDGAQAQSDSLTILLEPYSIPRTYASTYFPYVSAANDFGRFCKECSFRPWAISTAGASSVTVEVDGLSYEAAGSGRNWFVPGLSMAAGQTAIITPRYGDGRVGSGHEYVFNGTSVADGDHDFVADSADNCPTVANTDQADNDDDGTGNVCDSTPNGEPGGSGSGSDAPQLCDPTPFDAGCVSDLDEFGRPGSEVQEAVNTVYDLATGGL